MAQHGDSVQTVVREPVSVLSTLRFYYKSFTYNRLITCLFRYFRWKRRDFFDSVKPSLIKTYAARPSLPARVFLPKHQGQGDSATCPLFFLIHGGGWVIGDAQMDDQQARLLADEHGYCVVSLEYRLAPRHKFPTAIFDCLAIMKAVLSDKTLPIDRDRVVLGGFSAGAVMTLALAQLPEVKAIVKALVAFYPLADFTGEGRPEGVVSKWGREDHLPKQQPMYDWAYIPVGQNLRDPLLSPIYASREAIPQPLFLITAEADCLCYEGHRMACKLGGVDEGSETYSKDQWEKDGVRYCCVKDMPHCFTHFFERIKDPEWERRRQQANKEVWQEIGEWLEKILA